MTADPLENDAMAVAEFKHFERRRTGSARRMNGSRDVEFPLDRCLRHPGEEQFEHTILTPPEHLGG